MIVTPSWCAMMARYNTWQNRNLLDAADGLDEASLKQDRGAFFGSIAGTLNHLLWADLVWMSRFDGGEAPPGSIPESAGLWPDWGRFRAARAAADRRILGWADRLESDHLAGDLAWFSGAVGRELNRPLALCVGHFFNHQTHHRGQVHAMLTAAGAAPGPTDLFVMPEDIGL